MNNPITLWQHGTGAHVEYPSQTLLLRHTGNALRVVGVAGSTNWLQYPFILLQHPQTTAVQLSLIRLRYRCDSPTALITNLDIFDAETRVFRTSGLNYCSSDWEEITLPIDRNVPIRQSLNISIGIRFDGADQDTHALEISGVGVDVHHSTNTVL